MIDIVVNPIAGNGNAKHVCKQITELFESKNIPYRCFYTKFRGNGKDIAEQAVNNHADLLLSVGGDGTTYEVIDGLINTGIPLGIIPAGTGNDFAKAINMPSNPLDCLNKILTCKAKDIDLGTINGKAFLNIIGTGIDVNVLKYAAHYKKYFKGKLSYVAGIISAIANHTSQILKIKIDDKIELNEKFVICAIANGKYFGGGIPISKYAEPADSYFDVILLKDVPRISIIYYLIELLKGKILRHEKALYYRAKKIEIEGLEPISFQSDGEIFDLDKAEIKILPKTLKVICEENK